MEIRDFRQDYITDICGLLEDKEFIKKNTVEGTKNGFSRNRKLPFIFLIILIMQGLSRSIQRELNSFYQKVKNSDFSIQEVTKGAFTHARGKLKWEAFKELNKEGIDSFYRNAPYLTWNGFKVLAIDGSTLRLPNHKTIEKEFGIDYFGPDADVPHSMARISMLYDVLNFTTLDAQIGTYHTCERDLARRHLPAVNPGTDLVIMDRGYGGFEFTYDLQQKGIDYCIRLRDDWWKEVQEMIDKGETDKVITLQRDQQFEMWPKMRLFYAKELTCRVVIVTLPTGGIEVLITSLVDQEKYSYDSFLALYAKRWNIEEGYKLYKTRLLLDAFSGKTALAIKQDFHAKIFMMTTMAVLAFPIEEKLKKEQEQTTRQHPYKINRTNALSMTKEICFGLFIKKVTKKALEAIDKILTSTVEIVRPHRSNPRKKRTKQPPSMNYKQL